MKRKKMPEEWYRDKHEEKWDLIIEEFKDGNLISLYALDPYIMEIMGEVDYNHWDREQRFPIRGDYACEYTYVYGGDMCENCPIVKKCGVCRFKNSVHTKLLQAIDDQDQLEAIRLAKLMRDGWRKIY